MTPTLLISGTPAKQAVYRDALRALDASLEVALLRDGLPDPASIDVALVWNHPPGDLLRYPNLRLVIAQGAGVDAVLADATLPPTVPLVRLVDTLLTSAMVEHVLLAVLRHHRDDAAYRAFQARKEWRPLPAPATAERRIGMLGLGELGLASARALASLGFPVEGWTRRARSVDGVASCHGSDSLLGFLSRSSIVVCLLPLTPDTRHLLDERAFAAMPKGAYLVNPARGAIVDDRALLAALDSGHLAGAALDVFETEPLPADHPYWRHGSVIVTPHVASETIPASVAPQVLDAIRSVRRGAQPLNLVDRSTGY